MDTVAGPTLQAASVTEDVARGAASAAGEIDVGAAAWAAGFAAVVVAAAPYAGDTAEGAGLWVASAPGVAGGAKGADRQVGTVAFLPRLQPTHRRIDAATGGTESGSSNSLAVGASTEASADDAHPFEGVTAVADAGFTVLPTLGELRQLTADALTLGVSGAVAAARARPVRRRVRAGSQAVRPGRPALGAPRRCGPPTRPRGMPGRRGTARAIDRIRADPLTAGDPSL